jgi:hypothetical protein
MLHGAGHEKCEDVQVGVLDRITLGPIVIDGIKMDGISLYFDGIPTSVTMGGGEVFDLGLLDPCMSVLQLKEKLSEISEMSVRSQQLYLVNDIRSGDGELELKDAMQLEKIVAYTDADELKLCVMVGLKCGNVFTLVHDITKRQVSGVIGSGECGRTHSLANPRGVAIVPSHPHILVVTTSDSIRVYDTRTMNRTLCVAGPSRKYPQYTSRSPVYDPGKDYTRPDGGSQDGGIAQEKTTITRHEMADGEVWRSAAVPAALDQLGGVVVTSDSSHVVVSEGKGLQVFKLAVDEDGNGAVLEFVRAIGQVSRLQVQQLTQVYTITNCGLPLSALGTQPQATTGQPDVWPWSRVAGRR